MNGSETSAFNLQHSALILIDHAGQSAAATDAAQQLIEEALAVGALIGAVRTPEENEDAAKAQLALKSVRKQIESAYRAAKDPLVKLGRACDQTFQALVNEIDHEDGRIGHLVEEFAMAERRRVAAEQALAKEKMDKLEAEKHAAIAATPDPVQQSNLLEHFSRRAAMEAPAPAAPSRAPGQKIREDWDIKVQDIIETAKWALMTSRWDVIKIEVRLSVVKELLNGGMRKIPGLDCKLVPKAGVVLPAAQKAIDV